MIVNVHIVHLVHIVIIFVHCHTVLGSVPALIQPTANHVTPKVRDTRLTARKAPGRSKSHCFGITWDFHDSKGLRSQSATNDNIATIP